MKAAVYYGAHDVRWEEVPEPSCSSDGVKVRVAYNGICGTDVHEYFNGPLRIPTTPHRLTGAKLPLIIGHEFSGTVVELGNEVHDLNVGDRVAIEPFVRCHRCAFCESGQYNHCENRAVHGLSALGGGLSEITVVAREMAFRLPDDVSLEQGALVESLAVSQHAISRARLNEGDTVLIFGGGPIGIGLALGLRALGKYELVIFEPAAHRRAILEQLVDATVLDPLDNDPVDHVMSLTSGRGADVTFDAAGDEKAFVAGLRSTRTQGQFIIVATNRTTSIEPNDILLREISVTGSSGHCRDFPPVIDIMARGGFPIDGWVEHYPVTRLDDAFNALRDGRAEKILIDVG